MSEVVIVGSGPAGISTALYTARGGLATTVISRGSGALGKTDKIQNYYGFSDVISGEELEQNGIEGARKLGVRFVEAEAVSLGFADRLLVETTEGSYSADFVVLATGTQRKTVPIPGRKELEGKGVSYCAVCDAFFYRQKPVAVFGNGEYALHEAEALLPVAASVTLFTDGQPVSAAFPEEIRIEEGKIRKIRGAERVEAVCMEDGREIPVDGIFLAYGTAGGSDLAKKLGARTEENRVVVDERMRTSIPGLYSVGDCNGGMLQIAKAVYEGAVAGTDIVKTSRR
ncbi:MAG: FAD-dependent oxidoreductase [Clostridiales bacterium]|nr:FAD-dependent oxidoreductase [Clostridiales bacterium]